MMLRIFLLLLCLLAAPIAFAIERIDPETDMSEQQVTYHQVFETFIVSLNNYNTFVRERCQESKIIDCTNYMKTMPLLYNNIKVFLNLVNLISSPYTENAKEFLPSFSPDKGKIEYYSDLLDETIRALSSSLAELNTRFNMDTAKRKLYADFTVSMISLTGAMKECLKQQTQLSW